MQIVQFVLNKWHIFRVPLCGPYQCFNHSATTKVTLSGQHYVYNVWGSHYNYGGKVNQI